MKHRTTVVQTTTKQKQTRIDTWKNWCIKHRQYREGRELDVTRIMDVSCMGQRETVHLQISFCSWESSKILFSSLLVSLSHVICISSISHSPPPFVFTLFILFYYFKLLKECNFCLSCLILCSSSHSCLPLILLFLTITFVFIFFFKDLKSNLRLYISEFYDIYFSFFFFSIFY